MKFLVFLFFVVAYVTCDDPQSQIVEHYQDIHPDGNFQYNYKTSNGIDVKSIGIPKTLSGSPVEHSETIQGSYEYKSPEGKVVRVEYIADETGYHPKVIA